MKPKWNMFNRTWKYKIEMFSIPSQGGNCGKTNFQNSVACLFQNTPNKVWLYFSLLSFHHLNFFLQKLPHDVFHKTNFWWVFFGNPNFADSFTLSLSWSESFLNILLRFCLTFFSPFQRNIELFSSPTFSVVAVLAKIW